MADPGVISNQPGNINNLSQTTFRLSIKRLPNTVFFCQRVGIPTVSLSEAFQPAPNIDIQQPGDTITFGTLDIGFIVDESLNNYLELYDWMLGLGFPTSSTEFKSLATTNIGLSPRGNELSDATVIILDNNKNPSKEVHFKDCWPTSLSNIEFDTQITSIEPIIVDVSFVFQGAYTFSNII